MRVYLHSSEFLKLHTDSAAWSLVLLFDAKPASSPAEGSQDRGEKNLRMVMVSLTVMTNFEVNHVEQS